MEDNIQTVVVIIIATFLLFIFPVYMAYEKKDDISYSLAVRYTQDLVDEVRSKGYITKNMYDDYASKLKTTGNTYDIQLTHEYNRYDPITNYYKIEDNKYVLVKTTTKEEQQKAELDLKETGIEAGKLTENSSEEAINEYIKEQYKNQGIDKVEKTYRLSTEVYTTNYILSILNSERKLLLGTDDNFVTCSDDENDDACQYAYIMNEQDNFNITIKNTNITLATLMYNMVTAGVLDSNTRIYVNYGGAILSEKWYGDVDYAKMKHDNLSLTDMEEVLIFDDARHYPVKNIEVVNRPYEKEPYKDFSGLDIAKPNNNATRYMVEFETRPEATTELREKGAINLAEYSGYNFALGNGKSNDTKDMLSISVGLNGVSLLVSSNEIKNSSKKIHLLENQTIIDINGDEDTHEVQRQINDYDNAKVYYESGVVKFKLDGKRNVKDIEEEAEIAYEDYGLWTAFNFNVNNPTKNSNKTLKRTSNGAVITQTLTLREKELVATATSVKPNRLTILSYPVTINEYTKIKVEFIKQDDGTFVAYLYINDVKVAESIKVNTLPKVNMVGMSYIGTEANSYFGSIRNVKIYEVGD